MEPYAPLKLRINPTTLRPRLERRLRDLGKSARAVSREAELSDSALRNILEGKSKSPRLETIMSLARVLMVEPDWFLEDIVHPDNPKLRAKSENIAGFLRDQSDLGRDFSDANKMRTLVAFVLPKALPSGDYISTDEQFYFMQHFDFRKTNEEQYAFMVRTDGMYPVYRTDDIVFLDPSAEMVVDEDYLIYSNSRRVENLLLMRLARISAFSNSFFQIKTFNPEKSSELDRREWYTAHRVVKRIPAT